jgi:hypothetical protein
MQERRVAQIRKHAARFGRIRSRFAELVFKRAMFKLVFQIVAICIGLAAILMMGLRLI